MPDSFYMKIGNHATNMLADYVEKLVDNSEIMKFKDLISEKFPESKRKEIKALAFGGCKEKDTYSSVPKVFTSRIKKYSLDIVYDPYILKRINKTFPINTSKSNPEIKKYNSLNGSRETRIRVEYILKKSPLQFFKKEGLSEVWVWPDDWFREDLEGVIESDVIILNKEKIEELENILKNNKRYLRLARDMEW